MWWECIKKIWEVDPLICTHRGSKMKIISFIDERAVIKKILVHLYLYTEPKQQLARISHQSIRRHLLQYFGNTYRLL